MSDLHVWMSVTVLAQCTWRAISGLEFCERPGRRLFRTRKERKKTDNPREGWEDGTPPPHRDFKERGVVR